MLKTLLEKITGKPRYSPEIKWSSNSWTHNVFRVYEMIFGRKYGIRAELSSIPFENKTLYYCHSWESVFALTETKVRELLKGLVPKISLVYVPQLQTTNGFNLPLSNSPYLFAIAFDAVSSNDGGVATTNTYSHTCTGSDLTLTTGAIGVQSPAVAVAAIGLVSVLSWIAANYLYRWVELPVARWRPVVLYSCDG